MNVFIWTGRGLNHLYCFGGEIRIRPALIYFLISLECLTRWEAFKCGVIAFQGGGDFEGMTISQRRISDATGVLLCIARPRRRPLKRPNGRTIAGPTTSCLKITHGKHPYGALQRIQAQGYMIAPIAVVTYLFVVVFENSCSPNDPFKSVIYDVGHLIWHVWHCKMWTRSCSLRHKFVGNDIVSHKKTSEKANRAKTSFPFDHFLGIGVCCASNPGDGSTRTRSIHLFVPSVPKITFCCNFGSVWSAKSPGYVQTHEWSRNTPVFFIHSYSIYVIFVFIPCFAVVCFLSTWSALNYIADFKASPYNII